MHPTIAIVPMALLLLAACGGDSSGESEGAATSPGQVGATLTSPSGVAITLNSVTRATDPAVLDVLPEGRPEGFLGPQDVVELVATVVNGSDSAVSLEQDDVTMVNVGPEEQAAAFESIDEANGSCPQIFSPATPPPGEVAPGAETTWTSRFICFNISDFNEYLARFSVSSVTFTGDLPESGSVDVQQSQTDRDVTVTIDSITRLSSTDRYTTRESDEEREVFMNAAYQVSARVMNESGDELEMQPGDVRLYSVEAAQDASAQDASPTTGSSFDVDGFDLPCLQANSNSVGGEMRAPGELASGDEAEWTSTFVCLDFYERVQFRTVYQIESLTFGVEPQAEAVAGE